MRFTVPLFNKQRSIFTWMSAIGVASAVVQTFILMKYVSLDWWLLPVMFVTSSVAFLFCAMTIKVFTGKENHVMLRYFIAVMLLNYLVTRLLNLPTLLYLDLLALGYGAIVLFGRTGCFMVGCCHGKPNSWGVSYTHAHVKEGFTEYYSGVRLFPVQLAEACGLLLILVACVAVLLSGFPEGAVFTVFISLYGVLRFSLEFFRGDPARPYWLSFSEAQWTILLVNIFLLCGALFNWFPIGMWQTAISYGIFLALVVFGFARVLNPRFRFSEPNHVKEIMTFRSENVGGNIRVLTTSQGLNISGVQVGNETQYTLSRNKKQLSQDDIFRLAEILQLRHHESKPEIHSRDNGVYQVVFRKSAV